MVDTCSVKNAWNQRTTGKYIRHCLLINYYRSSSDMFSSRQARNLARAIEAESGVGCVAGDWFGPLDR